MPTFVNT